MSPPLEVEYPQEHWSAGVERQRMKVLEALGLALRECGRHSSIL